MGKLGHSTMARGEWQECIEDICMIGSFCMECIFLLSPLLLPTILLILQGPNQRSLLSMTHYDLPLAGRSSPNTFIHFSKKAYIWDSLNVSELAGEGF